MKRWLVGTLFGAMIAGSVMTAQKPPENVNPKRHPNLAAAQHHIRQASEKVLEAQKANEWDLAGHAQKAKGLLDQADAEIKLAAEAANRR